MATQPRFAGEKFARNQRFVAALDNFATVRGLCPAHVAIAWVRAKNPTIVPVLGAGTRAQLAEALGALAVELSADDVTALEALMPADEVAGTRYHAAQMAHLDSERT